MTPLEAMLSVSVLALWLAVMRLHAEVIVLRQERDALQRDLRAILTVYRKS